MHFGLQKIALEAENNLQKAQRSFYLIEETIGKIKEFISSYIFKDKEEEIVFFKNIKPSFQKELIFFEKLYYIEARRPMGSEEAEKEFLKLSLIQIQSFFDENKHVYCYHLTGDTSLDTVYFVRGEMQNPLQPVSTSDMDLTFSTPFSFTLAKLQAYEKLKDYLLLAMNPERHQAGSGDKKKSGLTWTDSKAALIELVYALQARGSFNFGQSNIKQIVAELESLFHVQLGNVYTVKLGMNIRKKSRTPFLDNLKSSLEKDLDDDLD